VLGRDILRLLVLLCGSLEISNRVLEQPSAFVVKPRRPLALWVLRELRLAPTEELLGAYEAPFGVALRAGGRGFLARLRQRTRNGSGIDAGLGRRSGLRSFCRRLGGGGS
jgi:hypothetical protein